MFQTPSGQKRSTFRMATEHSSLNNSPPHNIWFRHMYFSIVDLWELICKHIIRISEWLECMKKKKMMNNKRFGDSHGDGTGGACVTYLFYWRACTCQRKSCHWGVLWPGRETATPTVMRHALGIHVYSSVNTESLHQIRTLPDCQYLAPTLPWACHRCYRAWEWLEEDLFARFQVEGTMLSC